MQLKTILSWAVKELRTANVSEPESSALVLLGETLGMSRTEILAHPEKRLSPLQINRFKGYIRKREKHESVWQIIGKVRFMDLTFSVNKNVLVPRPETELLVEQVIQQITKFKHQISKESQIQNTKFKILDVGTGSGAIIVSLAKALTDAGSKFYRPNLSYSFYATDISPKALAVAKRNAKELKVEKFIKFIKADLFPPKANSQKPTAGRYDIIVSNLPYIPSEDMSGLALEVHHYEPKLALNGGKGGLEIYERFIAKVGGYLKPNSMIYCEIGINQGDDFKKLVGKYHPNSKVKILGDLAGIDRVAIINTNIK